METRQNYTDEEIEIDIRQLLIYCIEGAWRILLAGLLCLLLLGGYKFAKGLAEYRSLQSVEQTKLKSGSADEELYELQKESYLSQIENLKKQLQQKTEYRDASPLMKLNPDDFYEARLSWFVTTNYQIDPKLSLQTPDRTESVLAAYRSLLTSGAFYSYLHERIATDIPEKYLSELVMASVESGFLQLRIVGGEEKLVTELAGAAQSFLIDRKESIASAVTAHELRLLNAAVYDSLDKQPSELNISTDSIDSRETETGIRERQAELETGISDLQTQITGVQKQLNELQKPEEPAAVAAAVRSAAKFGLLGFLLGAFLVAGYRALRFLFTNPLVEEGEAERRLGLVVLGSKRRYPAQGILNRINAALSGDEARQRTEEETCGFAAENLRALLEISPAAEASGILLLGTDEVLVKDAYERINTGWKGEPLGFAGDILRSMAAVEQLRSYRRVVLVEAKGKLPFEKLRQECEKLRLLQKEICGIVLL